MSNPHRNKRGAAALPLRTNIYTLLFSAFFSEFAAIPQIPTSIAAGDTARRCRRWKNWPPQKSFPSPWAPADGIVDPERRVNLLRLMQSEIERLERSPFYRRFLLRLRSYPVREGLAGALASASSSAPAFNIVVYGVGSIESRAAPRTQLALAFLLHRELGPAASSLEVFDPVLSATECAVAAALGFSVPAVDEGGCREVTSPTLFYMPHCPIMLYDSMLRTNWRSSGLNRMVVLGNSFGTYDRCDEMGHRIVLEDGGRYILRVLERGLVREVEMEARTEEEEEEEEEIFRAFRCTNWHFFWVPRREAEDALGI